jgi:uncharacterized membrane protein
MYVTIAVTWVVLILLDMIWFQISASTIYSPIFTKINGMSGYLVIPSALLSWALIATLITMFAKNTTESFTLGVLSYGIYNATNFATIRHWTLRTLIADTLWGGIVSALAFTLVSKIMTMIK